MLAPSTPEQGCSWLLQGPGPWSNGQCSLVQGPALHLPPLSTLSTDSLFARTRRHPSLGSQCHEAAAYGGRGMGAQHG